MNIRLTPSVSRFVLLTCACLVLQGCDNSAPDQNDNPRADEHAGNIFSMFQNVELEPTWAGSYLSSRVAQNRFDWARAETFLNQVDADRDGNPILERRLMLLAMGAGNYPEALKQAKLMNMMKDESGLTALILMLEPIRDGQFITARDMLEKVPKSTLSNFIYPLLQTWLDAARGKTDLAGLRGSRSYYYHQVMLADYLNQIDLVADKRLLLAAHEQLSAISAERMADIFLRRKQYDLALLLYKTTQLLNPNVPGLSDKIKACEDKTDPLPATITLAPAINNPTEGIAYAFFDMAMSFYNEQSLESAQLFTQMALALKPDLHEGRLLIGNMLSRNGRIDAAIEAYNSIPRENPRYKAVQQQIAQLLVQQHRNDEAIKALTNLASTATEAEQIDYLTQIGDIYRDQEKFSDALNYYNQAAEKIGAPIGSSHWQLLYARGMTLERLKKWDDAERDLKQALQYQPNHPYLLNYLAYSWADQGLNLDEAAEMLAKAVTLAPNDGYITDSVGWVAYKMNEFDKAVEYLERAVELMPYDPTINDHLGDAYAKVNRKREAEFQWRRAYNYSDDAEQKRTIEEKLSERSAAAETPP